MQIPSLPSSVPSATRQRIGASVSAAYSGFSEASSGYETVTSSWGSVQGSQSQRPEHPPLAWTAAHHQILDNVKGDGSGVGDRASGRCTQAVLLTCLYLSHEMALREVGQYAWTTPVPKDPQGSMIRVMEQYASQLQACSFQMPVDVRTVPDPSKGTIQHHLQKARLAAGRDSYVAVLYCGHGIQEPPTEAGELWCYDRSFEECMQGGGGPSEYIPILVFDLLTWAGASTCYVWDCQNAGRIIRAALAEADEIDSQLREAGAQNASVGELHPAVYARRQIHFAACGANETLPRIPDLPDDLFTACLTTPLRVALLFHNFQSFALTTTSSRHAQRSARDMLLLWTNMSEDLKGRLWSELQAILFNIAWSNMDPKEYQKLFGQAGDVVSSLAAGFLLSQRVMGAYRAHPESIPPIPSSIAHALWTHWDLILDNFFEQTPEYFEDGTIDHGWEKGLRLVTFLSDQLDSVLSVDPAAHDTYLSRLPIICQAVASTEHRQRACEVLDICLQNLDTVELTRAIHGGALHAASQLLTLRDTSLATATHLVSIWASLVRHDASVAVLAQDGRTAERLTSVPSVKFFLDGLEQHLGVDVYDQSTTRRVTQLAAVLSAIANFVAGRQASRFLTRTLSLGSIMLKSEEYLIGQWGALLVAEVLGSIEHTEDTHRETLDMIQNRLLSMVESSSVETRAASIYALSRRIPSHILSDITHLEATLGIADKLAVHATLEGSAIVRKELVRLFDRVLHAGGKWSSFTVLIWALELAKLNRPQDLDRVNQLILETERKIGLTAVSKRCVLILKSILLVLQAYSSDPDRTIEKLVLKLLLVRLTALGLGTRPEIAIAVLRGQQPVEDLEQAAVILVNSWAAWEGERDGDLKGFNNELFERSKRSLHVYLGSNSRPTLLPDQPRAEPETVRERTVFLRQRLLEDSIVVAEQQVGLPWQWQMKDINSPDSWSTVHFHSFLNTVMSCNNSDRLLFWDWRSSKKTGQVKLDLPPGAIIKSARMIHELHDDLVVLAEISNGDIHVLSGHASEPDKIRTMSSFSALDIGRYKMPVVDPDHRRLVCTWWRQSGKLCVGGPAPIIKAWDGPSERCVRIVDTNSTQALTTMITEPVSGNIIITGFADGLVKLYDMRQARRQPLLTWLGDRNLLPNVQEGQAIAKLGVVLGESTHITAACSNGILNVHDLRNLSEPTSSILIHPTGISSASFQAHSGLMSTISTILPNSNGAGPSANWGIYRSNLSLVSAVTEETIDFGPQEDDVKLQDFKPYTVVHPLRPFLGIGYGRTCFLRSCGVGSGDDTDSGSYSFLRAQARFFS
ncbi:raptor N-terminal caspase like domain-domain-containing protein [Naematelia encephala]|uniref:Raptor N-terminal caspase like domain-domain-containing protein n=1 Tax=Naematelia encephala TaxID=71784 RepID=A0A1Y2BCY4_9TREE|nr:raptor N-terminal caspase like domain-domain-containing protein [Naematelia encephala]